LFTKIYKANLIPFPQIARYESLFIYKYCYKGRRAKDQFITENTEQALHEKLHFVN